MDKMTAAEMIELGDGITAGYEKLQADIAADRLTQEQIEARFSELEAMKDRFRAAAYTKIPRH